MDNYTEQILDKKVSGKQILALAGAIIVTGIGVIGILFLSSSMGFSVIIVGAVLIYLANRAQSVEYEYLFTNGDCEVSKIINKSARKKYFSFDVGDVQRILPYNSEKFQNELQINSDLTIKNLTSGFKFREELWYAFIVNSKGSSIAVILELYENSYEHVNSHYRMKLEK